MWQLRADACYFMAMQKNNNNNKKDFSDINLNMKNVADFCNEVRVIHFQDMFRGEYSLL